MPALGRFAKFLSEMCTPKAASSKDCQNQKVSTLILEPSPCAVLEDDGTLWQSRNIVQQALETHPLN